MTDREDRPVQQPDPEATVRGYYDLVDAGRVDDLLGLFAADAVYDRQGRPRMRGADELRRFYEVDRSIAAGNHHVEHVLAGDEWVAVRGRFAGRLKSGDRVDEEFTDWHHVRDGRIVYRQSLFPGRAL